MDRSNFIDRAIASALVTEVLISGADVDRRETVNCEKNHIWPTIFSASAGMTGGAIQYRCRRCVAGTASPRSSSFKKVECILRLWHDGDVD
jgi:hypothetical protein